MNRARLLCALSLCLLTAHAGAGERAIFGAAREPARMTWIGNTGFHVTTSSDVAALAQRLRREHQRARQDHPHDHDDEPHIIFITITPAAPATPAPPPFTNRHTP